MSDVLDVTYEDLEKYVGKSVQLNYSEAGLVAGRIEKANDKGVMFKPKGSTIPEILDYQDITQYEVEPETPTTLKTRRIDVLKDGAARRHLLDRHSVGLAAVNEMTEESAELYHEGLDHSDLGHFHAEKPERTEHPAEATGSENGHVVDEQDDLNF